MTLHKCDFGKWDLIYKQVRKYTTWSILDAQFHQTFWDSKQCYDWSVRNATFWRSDLSPSSGSSCQGLSTSRTAPGRSRNQALYRARLVLCKYPENRNIYFERVTGLMYIMLSCTELFCGVLYCSEYWRIRVEMWAEAHEWLAETRYVLTQSMQPILTAYNQNEMRRQILEKSVHAEFH